MKVLIIEDELLAQARLESMLIKYEPSIIVLAKLGSVTETIQWLKHNPPPEIAFVDIQLSDDHSFEIFKNVAVTFPIIFTTAYDKYLLESFEFNAIDYLLKPINDEKLKRSIEKVRKLEQHFMQGKISQLMSDAGRRNERIVVKKGMEYAVVNCDDIAYFFTDHRIVFLRDFNGKQFITDKNLGELETLLDEQKFFRINRKYIANIRSIEKFKPDNGKIRVILNPEIKEEIHVSKETAPLFRKWIGHD